MRGEKAIEVVTHHDSEEFQEIVNEFINRPEVKLLDIKYATTPLVEPYVYPVEFTAFIEYEKV